MEELLRVENVSFAYEEGREEYPALCGCSVTVSAGERIAVLGLCRGNSYSEVIAGNPVNQEISAKTSE